VRRWLAAGAVAAAAGVAGFVAAGGGGSPRSASAQPPAPATATVERRDLVARDDVDGTLGYADTGTLPAGLQGVLTAIRSPGAVVTRGHSLYSLDGEAAAFLLYGALPAWRDFTPGMTDGEDVRQLERNLRALGYDPGTVDDDWDWETTRAVVRFQRARGLTQDGSLSRGQLVFRDGPLRMGEAKAELGASVGPGTPLAAVSSTARRVSVQLDARRQAIAREGATVTVDLPGGRTARGRIEEVGTVASKQSEDADPTIAVTIRLRGAGSGLDGAPVTVGFAVERRRNALAVPVKALLARQGGGYAVETPGHRVIPVEPGVFADDWVAVRGSGLEEGMKVVTAR
jgi:peptidoglycan hydrolase-like protein with peptidoglycan-binding domain